MIFVIIELPNQLRFNPFLAHHLFDFYHNVKDSSKKFHLPPPISLYTGTESMTKRMTNLSNQFNRFLVLEMLLNNLNEFYEAEKNQDLFEQSIQAAEFHFGSLVTPIKRKAAREEKRTDSISEPFAQIQKPNEVLRNQANEVVNKLGDDNLPQSCLDPISNEPLSDPIEINNRIYNRDTVVKMIKDGQFQDPFTRQTIDPSTAKEAHYMLEALSLHSKFLDGNERFDIFEPFKDRFKETQVLPLKELFEEWESSMNQQLRP